MDERKLRAESESAGDMSNITAIIDKLTTMPERIHRDVAANFYRDGWSATCMHSNGRVESIKRADIWAMPTGGDPAA